MASFSMSLFFLSAWLNFFVHCHPWTGIHFSDAPATHCHFGRCRVGRATQAFRSQAASAALTTGSELPSNCHSTAAIQLPTDWQAVASHLPPTGAGLASERLCSESVWLILCMDLYCTGICICNFICIWILYLHWYWYVYLSLYL